MLLSFRFTGSTVRLFPAQTINSRLYLITQLLSVQAGHNLGKAGPSKGVASSRRDLLGKGGRWREAVFTQPPAVGRPLQTTQHRRRLTSSAPRRRRRRHSDSLLSGASSLPSPVAPNPKAGCTTFFAAAGEGKKNTAATAPGSLTRGRIHRGTAGSRWCATDGGWCSSRCVESVTCEWFW